MLMIMDVSPEGYSLKIIEHPLNGIPKKVYCWPLSIEELLKRKLGAADSDLVNKMVGKHISAEELLYQRDGNWEARTVIVKKAHHEDELQYSVLADMSEIGAKLLYFEISGEETILGFDFFGAYSPFYDKKFNSLTQAWSDCFKAGEKLAQIHTLMGIIHGDVYRGEGYVARPHSSRNTLSNGGEFRIIDYGSARELSEVEPGSDIKELDDFSLALVQDIIQNTDFMALVGRDEIRDFEKITTQKVRTGYNYGVLSVTSLEPEDLVIMHISKNKARKHFDCHPDEIIAQNKKYLKIIKANMA